MIPVETMATGRATTSIRRYAVAALDNQVRKVEQAAKGSRNQTVNDAALQLGHLVAAGALSEAVVRQLLEDAACVCGLAKDDGIASVRSTVGSELSRLALGNRPISPNWVGALPGAARRGLPGGLWRLVTILPKAEVQRSSRSLREMPATMLAAAYRSRQRLSVCEALWRRIPMVSRPRVASMGRQLLVARCS